MHLLFAILGACCPNVNGTLFESGHAEITSAGRFWPLGPVGMGLSWPRSPGMGSRVVNLLMR